MKNLQSKAMTIEEQLEKYFNVTNAVCTSLNTLANDAISIETPDSHFALKLYNPASRTIDEVRWELELTLHLLQRGAPIAKPLHGKNGYVETFIVDGCERTVALFEWAPGEKPRPQESTYTLLGKAAAQIHQAADSFTSSLPREIYDAKELIDEQLHRMKDPLVQAGKLSEVSALGERMKQILKDSSLDYGICHMDLTLDNVHRDKDNLTVFDLDSAGACWRAIEPYGVLKFSEKAFNAWLKGYRSFRSFSAKDERAVYAFVIIGEIRNVVWKLGLAKSSRGEPLLKPSDLPAVVREWLDWERDKLDSRN